MPITYEVEIAENATFAQLRTKGKRPTGGARSKIKGFSKQSRKRMLDLLNKIPRDFRSQGLFITLTYPGEFSPDWEKWKRDLDVFLRGLIRRYPRIVVLWKLELQERGAPHYHLVVWGERFIPAGLVAQLWYDVVGSGDRRHLLAGTQVKKIRSDGQVMGYVCKYIAKVDSLHSAFAIGRIWGIRQRNLLPIRLHSYALDVGIFYEVRRVLRAFLERKLKRRITWGSRALEGLTVYIEPTTILKLIGLATAKVYG